MTDDLGDAAMKRILSSRAAETYVLASAETWGTASSHRIVGLSGVAGVVTDAPAGAPRRRAVRTTGCPRDPGVTSLRPRRARRTIIVHLSVTKRADHRQRVFNRRR
jgi:hypothetical protein